MHLAEVKIPLQCAPYSELRLRSTGSHFIHGPIPRFQAIKIFGSGHPLGRRRQDRNYSSRDVKLELYVKNADGTGGNTIEPYDSAPGVSAEPAVR